MIEFRKTNFPSPRLTVISIVVFFLTTLIAAYAQRSPSPLSAERLQLLRQQANTYGLDPAPVIEHYQAMFDENDLKAREAEWFFEKNKAYEILASALPNLARDSTAYGSAIDALVRKKTFNKRVFAALVSELDALNALPIEGGNELPGARQTLKKRICGAITNWLQLPPPQITLSAEPVAAFSAQAKAKAAALPGASSY
jgi:hypothetical protein